MTMPALIHRNSGTPVADAATSTSLGRDYKPVRPGRELTENRALPTKHDRGVLGTAHVGALPPASPEQNETTTIPVVPLFTCISLPLAIATWSAARHLKVKTQYAHRSTRFSLARFRAERRGRRGSCQRKTPRRLSVSVRRRFVEKDQIPAVACPKAPSRAGPWHSGRPADVSRGKSLNHAGSEENVVVGWKLSSISRIKFLCINFLKTTQYTTRWGTLALFPGFHVGISYKSWFTEGFDTRDLKDAKALLLPDLGYWSLWE